MRVNSYAQSLQALLKCSGFASRDAYRDPRPGDLRFVGEYAREAQDRATEQLDAQGTALNNAPRNVRPDSIPSIPLETGI
jgi:hypothetical protein